MEGFTGNKHADQEIVLRIDSDKQFLKTCALNSYMAEKVCDDDLFRRRMISKYPLLVMYKPKSIKWKQYYLKTIYDMAKLQEDYGIPYIPVAAFMPGQFLKTYEKSRGASKNIYEDAMVLAAAGGHINLVKLMLEKGAKNYQRVRYIAEQKGHEDIVDLMNQKLGRVIYYRE